MVKATDNSQGAETGFGYILGVDPAWNPSDGTPPSHACSSSEQSHRRRQHDNGHSPRSQGQKKEFYAKHPSQRHTRAEDDERRYSQQVWHRSDSEDTDRSRRQSQKGHREHGKWSQSRTPPPTCVALPRHGLHSATLGGLMRSHPATLVEQASGDGVTAQHHILSIRGGGQRRVKLVRCTMNRLRHPGPTVIKTCQDYFIILARVAGDQCAPRRQGAWALITC